jgi:hypothetical protein
MAKQTTDRVSKIAGRLLRQLTRICSDPLLGAPKWLYDDGRTRVRLTDVGALAASCLSQDETKGKRKAKRKP